MAAGRKSTVFRVTGLTRDQPDEVLETLLRAAINDYLSEEERSQIKTETTIVPSCYDDHERTALVQFRGGVPQFLLELIGNPLGDWQVEMGDIDINFDHHFLGFTQLYALAEEESVIAEYVKVCM
jgi:hypothetical protein